MGVENHGLYGYYIFSGESYQANNLRTLGISVVNFQIWGYHDNLKSRDLPQQIPMNHNLLGCMTGQ